MVNRREVSRLTAPYGPLQTFEPGAADGRFIPLADLERWGRMLRLQRPLLLFVAPARFQARPWPNPQSLPRVNLVRALQFKVIRFSLQAIPNSAEVLGYLRDLASCATFGGNWRTRPPDQIQLSDAPRNSLRMALYGGLQKPLIGHYLDAISGNIRTWGNVPLSVETRLSGGAFCEVMRRS